MSPSSCSITILLVYITTLLFNMWSKQPNKQEKKTEKCVISNKTLICALRPNDQPEKEFQGYSMTKNFPFLSINTNWKNEKKKKIKRIFFFKELSRLSCGSGRRGVMLGATTNYTQQQYNKTHIQKKQMLSM